MKDYSWKRFFANHADIYVRTPKGRLEYIGTTWGRDWYDPYDPGAFRVPMGCSEDGRSIVWAHVPEFAGDRSTKALGIYQYVYGEGDLLILPDRGATRIGPRGRPFPSDIVVSWKDRRYVMVTAAGEIRSLDLLEATALHEAASEGNEAKIASLLADGHGVNEKNYWGHTPLELAVRRGPEGAIVLLLEAGADTTFAALDIPLLHLSARRGYPRVLEILLESGADPNAIHGAGRTPLHEWAGSYVASVASDIEAFKVLVDHGADVNAHDKFGQTPLHYVIWYHGHVEANLKALDTLIAYGADVNSQDKKDSTPLHDAVLRFESPAIVEALIHHGADVDRVDHRGNTPLHLVGHQLGAWDAAQKVRWGGQVEGAGNKDLWDRVYRPMMEVLVSHTSAVDCLNIDGLSPLHLAVRRTAIYSAEFLVANGADDSVRYRPASSIHSYSKAQIEELEREKPPRTIRDQMERVRQSRLWKTERARFPVPDR